MGYALVEKRNHLALHGLFGTKERADQHLLQTVPLYVARGYFMDKALTADDFEVVQWNR